jgi:AbrB family looped-hinge helix DNA binding protein
MRAREAAAPYGSAAPDRSHDIPVHHVTVTDRGRIVLPAEIRARLRIRDGDRVAVTVEADGTISLTTPSVAIGQLRGMFKHIAPTDHFASDDIVARRRLEAQTENPENRRRFGFRRRIKKRR